MAGNPRTGRTGSEQADASFDTIGGELNQTRRDITALQQQAQRATRTTTVNAPTPAVPFIIAQVPDPASLGELDTFRALIPAGSEKLIIRTRRIDEPNQKIVEWEFDVEDAESAAGQIERTFPVAFDSDGQFGLVSMLVRGSGIKKARNPDPPNDAANLTTWITLGFFKTHTSRPDIGLILENKLDDVTKRFDAFIAVRCYCPINGNVNTYAGTVSINSTTTLTGTLNFNTQPIPVVSGMLVIASGQTRQVVSVAGGAGLTLVVDRAFVGAQAGLTLQYGVPHTWISSLTSMVIAKFQYADGSAHLDDQRHQIMDDEEGQNFVDWRIKGLLCPRRVSWVSNILVGGVNGRKRITPLSPQIFISGGFTDATAGIPELTSVAYNYDSTDPYNAKQPLTSVRMTQPTNCVALERAELYVRKTATGTASLTSTTNVVGVGTKFTEEFSKRSIVSISGQEREVAATPSDDTHLTVTVAFAAASGAITSAKLADTKPLDKKLYHPTGGGQIEIVWGEKHAKKLVAHTFRTIIYAMNTQTRNVDDAYTPGQGGPLDTDTMAPVFATAPRLRYKRGKLVADLDLAGATNIQTVKDRYAAIIHNNVVNLDLSDPLRKTAAAVFGFSQVNGPHFSHPQDLEQLVKIFGTGNIFVQFQVTNDVGTTTTSNSSAYSLSGRSDVTTLYNPNNRVRNGHFTAQDGTNAKRWLDYDPRSGSATALAVTGKVRFDLDAHRGKWRDTPTQDNQRFLIQNLGKTFFRSEYYSLIWNMYSNGTPTLDELVVGLFTKKTLSNNISGTAAGNTVSGTGFDTDLVKVGSVVGENSVGQWRTVTGVTATSLTVDRVWGSTFGPTPGFILIPQGSRLSETNVALTTADLFKKGLILTDSDLDASLDIYFCVILRDIVDTTTFPFIDAICMNAGQESAGYQLSVDSFETNFASTSENFDTPPTNGSSAGGSQLRGSGSGDPGEVVPITPY